jgi:RNA-directed DNA polymerase
MIVSAEGFVIHNNKTRIMRKGSRQKVTGLVVNAAPDRPPVRVPRETLRTLRTAIYNREKGRPGKGETLDHLRGMAAFVMMTDREKGHAFMQRINALDATTVNSQ